MNCLDRSPEPSTPCGNAGRRAITASAPDVIGTSEMSCGSHTRRTPPALRMGGLRISNEWLCGSRIRRDPATTIGRRLSPGDVLRPRGDRTSDADVTCYSFRLAPHRFAAFRDTIADAPVFAPRNLDGNSRTQFPTPFFRTPFFRIENDGPVPRTIFGETPSQKR